MFGRKRRRTEFGRVYAIGDVHGRLDLFGTLLARIEEDISVREPVSAGIILLGDMIDRGQQSADMVKLCMDAAKTSARFKCLKGNHEEVMVAALKGNLSALSLWLRMGGRETLASWGIDHKQIEGSSSYDLVKAARERVGEATLHWLDDLPLLDRHCGHLFVHAGIRPGLKISRQRPQDLLWIRDEFLRSEADHGIIVVHGHTPSVGGPEVRSNRIGIDTGAYWTGQLTAIAVEPLQTWFLSTSDTS